MAIIFWVGRPISLEQRFIWVSFWRALKFQPFSWRVGSNSRHQSKNIECNTKLIQNSCMSYVVYVTSAMWDLKINHLTLLLVLTMPYTCWLLCWVEYIWGLQVMSSFSMWDCILKGCFETCIFWRAKLRLKGIADFNLEHCFWTYVLVVLILKAISNHIPLKYR